MIRKVCHVPWISKENANTHNFNVLRIDDRDGPYLANTNGDSNQTWLSGKPLVKHLAIRDSQWHDTKTATGGTHDWKSISYSVCEDIGADDERI